jgi:hypothetical protein
MKKALMIIVAVLLAGQSTLAFARGEEKATLAKPAPKPKGKVYNWYVVVCSSRAEQVILQAGGNEDDSVVIAKWRQKDGQKRFPLPDWLQARTKVFVRMSIPDGTWQTEGCVGYDGYAKRALRFDRGNGNDNVSMDDYDDGCACR